MKNFKRLGITGDGFDVELTIKDPEIVDLINKYPEDQLKFGLNAVVNGFAQIFVNLKEEGFDPGVDQKPKVLTTYLAGPMEFAKGQGAKWRTYITEKLEKMNILVLNPCKIEIEDTGKSVKENIDDVTEAKRNADWDSLVEIMTQAQERDYTCVEESDFIIAYLDHSAGPGGTYCEIEHAKDQGIPIYGICLGELADENSWILTTIIRSGGQIFQSFEEVLEFIEANYKK
jgi:nucleoside 2-deoxyribosyltransferase